jgi:hypothetical protein
MPRRRSARVSFSFVYTKHFQPSRVFLGNVLDQVRSFNIPLLPIALCEIDQTRANGAKNVHAQA